MSPASSLQEIALSAASTERQSSRRRTVTFTWDVACDALTWSRGHDALLGLTPGERCGTWQSFAERVRGEDIATFNEEIARCVATGDESVSWQFRSVHPDHGIRWLALEADVRFDHGGQVVELRGVIADVTEHKRAEENLRRATERLQSIVDTNIVGFAVATSSGAVIEANDYYLHLIGYSREEFEKGRIDWRSLTPAEWLPADERAIQELRERGTCTPYEKEYRLRDGRRVSVFISDAMLKGTEEEIVAFVIDITERKRSEEALRQSENRFTVLFNKGAVPVVLSRLSDHVLVDVNDALVQLVGYTKEELIGKTSLEIGITRPLEDRTAAADEFESQRRLVGRERTVFPKSGEPLTILTNANVVSIGGEELVLTSVMDVTERQQAGEALRDNERRLRLSAQAGNIGLWDWNLENNDVYFSPEWKKQIGYRDEEISDRFEEWQIRVHPDDLHPTTQKVLDFITAPEGIHETEFRFHHKDGSWRWIYARADVIRDSSGKPLRMLGCHVDITTRKEAELALRQSEGRLRSALDAARMGIFDWDMVQDRLTASPRHDEIWGLSEESQRTSGRLFQRIHPDDVSGVKADLERCIASRTPHLGEFRVVWPDGSIHWILASGQFAFDDAGRPLWMYGVVLDITEHRRAEADIRGLHEQLRQHAAGLEQKVRDRTVQLEEANQELEAFTYSVSHDLRAPLRAINGFARILTEDHRDQLDAEGKRVLGVVRQEAGRMSGLIDDLLEFSRLGRRPVQKSMIDMTAMARQVWDELIGREENRTIDCRIDSLPCALADAALMRQVWINLLSNALKFTRKRERAGISVSASILQGETVYSIADNGAGFDERYAAKLFGVFQRLHSTDEFEGTGVGLALVQRIVRRHGGRVWGRSELNRGATFSFALPMTTSTKESDS